MKLHPDFPVIDGRYRLTATWELELPEPFNRRMEEGDMVIWRPGLTFWIAVWGAQPDQTIEATLAWILEDASPSRSHQKIDRSEDLLRLTYELAERDPDRTPTDYVSISGYVIAPVGHVQITAYCDTPDAQRTGRDVIASVRVTPAR